MGQITEGLITVGQITEGQITDRPFYSMIFLNFDEELALRFRNSINQIFGNPPSVLEELLDSEFNEFLRFKNDSSSSSVIKFMIHYLCYFLEIMLFFFTFIIVSQYFLMKFIKMRNT